MWLLPILVWLALCAGLGALTICRARPIRAPRRGAVQFDARLVNEVWVIE
jgi:hypothetical protein